MDISITTIFAIFGIVSAWAKTALADRKVTLVEGLQLLQNMATLLGVKTELEIPGMPTKPVIEADLPPKPAQGETEPAYERPPPRPGH